MREPAGWRIAGPDGEACATVVQVGKYYALYTGGTESNTRQVAEALADRYRIYVLCMRHMSGRTCAGRVGRVPVIRLGQSAMVCRQAITTPPNRLLKRLAPDCSHFHGPNPLLAWYIAAFLAWRLRNHALRVASSRSRAPPTGARPAKLGYRWLRRRARRIITYTDAAFEASRKLVGLESKKAMVPHGMSAPGSTDTRTNGDGPESSPACGRPLRIGYLGRLESWKGVHVLIEALARLDDFTLHIAGTGSARPMLERQVTMAGLRERVSFRGEVVGTAKWEFLGNIDVLVLLSLGPGETFGQVLVEAQMMGVPVIVSDLPTGVREVVDDGRAGILVEPGNPVALRQALEELCAPRRRTLFAQLGARHARERFSEAAAVAGLPSLYETELDTGGNDTFAEFRQ